MPYGIFPRKKRRIQITRFWILVNFHRNHYVIDEKKNLL